MGQTAAHLRYITRPQAARVVIRARVDDSDAKSAKKAEIEAHKRKGRVAERFIVALPVEASNKQREELGSALAELITNRRAGYILAIHDFNDNDLKNPHMHLVVFDSFVSGGGRGRPKSIVGMARKGAVERTCAAWANLHNAMMRNWGYNEQSMISHLSYRAQDIDRIPTIHEGPGGRKMAQRSDRPKIKGEWKHIDHGRSRQDANSLIAKINYMKKELEYGRSNNRLGNGDPFDPQERRSSSAERWPVHRSTRGANSAPETDARRHKGDEKQTGLPFTANGKREDLRRADQPCSAPERSKEASHERPANIPPWNSGVTRSFRRDWISLTILSQRLRAALRRLSRRKPQLASPLPAKNFHKKEIRQIGRVAE